jgi:hypothetical protein
MFPSRWRIEAYISAVSRTSLNKARTIHQSVRLYRVYTVEKASLKLLTLALMYKIIVSFFVYIFA